MNAIDLLEKDHSEARRAMEAIAGARGSARQDLFKAFKHRIEIHDVLEETIFYPALLSHPKTFGYREMDKEAHKVVETALDTLAALAPDAGEWSRSFNAVRGVLMKHMDDEEFKVFIRIREVMSPDELAEIGDRMNRGRDRLIESSLVHAAGRA